MSENQLPPDDPRLTAYALGELDPTEQEALERLLADSPQAQAAVHEIRELAGVLTTEMRQEPVSGLTAEQRTAILAAGPSAAQAVQEPNIHVAGQAHDLSVRPGSSSPPARSRARKLNVSVKRFASLATIAALIIVVAAFLPPPRETQVELSELLGERRGDALHLAMQLDDFAARDGNAGERDFVMSDGSVQFRASSGSLFGTDPRLAGGDANGFGRGGGAKSAGANSPAGGGFGLPQKVAGQQTVDNPVAKPGFHRPAGTAGGRPGDSRSGRTLAATANKTNMPAAEKQRNFYHLAPELPELQLQESRTELAKEGKPDTTRLKVAQGVGSGRGFENAGGDLGGKRIQDESAPQTGPARLSAGMGGRRNSMPSSGEESGVTGKPAEGFGSKTVAERFAPAKELGAPLMADGRRRFAIRPENLAQEVERIVDITDKAGTHDPDAAVSALGRTLSTLNETKELKPEIREELRVKVQSSLDRNLARRAERESGRVANPDRFSKERLGEESKKFFSDLDSLGDGLVRESDEYGLGFRFTRYKRLDAPGTEFYEPIVENQFFSAYEAPLSTFGIDVDTASYANVRRFLTSQQLPPPNAVRIEELVNYFSYDYPQPAAGQPFSVNIEAANCPWTPGHQLVRIALKGREIPRDQRPASNLVFLVDVSGSMQAENKLPLVKMGLNLLTQQMTESDQVAIVTYSDSAVQRLGSTNGTNKQQITQVIDSLQAAGSTNGAAGIQLAYRAALDHFIDGGTNRVILCTDGDFNVGVSDDDQLVQMIQERARTKVFFSVFGFGMGNLKDGKLEKLADKGNGHYAYVDGQREAHKLFVDELVGTLVTIAKDVKLQVEFNPNQVGAYRLLGYENRVMAAQDFNNDRKDAGEMGAGHTVTALYEIVPAGDAPRPEAGFALRYRKAIVPQEGEVARELLTVKLRYKLPEADASTLVEIPAAAAGLRAVGLRKAGVAGQPDGAAEWYSFQLQRSDADAAAKSLGLLFGNSKDGPAIESDAANRRLKFRGSAEQISQARKLLEELGESGNVPSRDFNWAAAVAAFGMILRDSQFRGQANFDMVLELAQGARGEDKAGRRTEFIELVKLARTMYQPASPTAPDALPAITLTREQAEAKASMNGKYRNLLRIVPAAGDATIYGSFNENGHWDGTSYLGHDNLPPGYWVYVAPNWYIWGDAK